MVLQQQDSVGLATFDDAVRRYLKPAGQPSHLKELLHVMDVTPAGEKSDMGDRLPRPGRAVQEARAWWSILSDLFDDVPRILAGLKHFRHRRHEVIVFHILDPAELDFPFREHDPVQGAGRAARDPRPSPTPCGRAYQAEIGAFLDELKKGCRMIDIDYVPLRTDQELDGAAVELPGVAGDTDEVSGDDPTAVRRLVLHADESAHRAQDEETTLHLPLVLALGLRQPPAALRPGRGVGADHHPPAEPAQVPRGAVGGDAVPAGGDPQELSGGSGSSSGSCWRSGRW